MPLWMLIAFAAVAAADVLALAWLDRRIRRSLDLLRAENRRAEQWFRDTVDRHRDDGADWWKGDHES